ncbi:MAG TPA: DUF1559 domain-containing protein [Planctomycetaceae bacterium]|nr:DUF1559 domain-containing protein [Planctomycetaceae bacterium]
MISLRAMNRGNKQFPSSKWTKRGLTHLELLFVLCLILVIVAILFPAIPLAREAARRDQCRNNLKVIGLAVHNYHDVYNCFPAGFEVPAEGNYLGWGWNSKILPYMNAEDLYHKMEPHLAEGIHGLPDLPEFKQRLPALGCPSDTGSETVRHAMIVTEKVVDGLVSAGTEDWPNRLPRSSYFGNAGYLALEDGGIHHLSAPIPTSIMPLTNAGSLGNYGAKPSPNHRYCDQKIFSGYFGQNSYVNLREVVYGTSNSIMIGERYSPVDISANAVGHGTWIGVPDCTRAQGLAMALADASVRINIGMPYREQTTGFGSLHHDGAFFLLGDGSTRFINQKIDTSLFRNLSLINDGNRRRTQTYWFPEEDPITHPGNSN